MICVDTRGIRNSSAKPPESRQTSPSYAQTWKFQCANKK